MIPDIHFPARKAEKAKGKICKNLHAVATYFPIQKKKEMDIWWTASSLYYSSSIQGQWKRIKFYHLQQHEWT